MNKICTAAGRSFCGATRRSLSSSSGGRIVATEQPLQGGPFPPKTIEMCLAYQPCLWMVLIVTAAAVTSSLPGHSDSYRLSHDDQKADSLGIHSRLVVLLLAAALSVFGIYSFMGQRRGLSRSGPADHGSGGPVPGRVGRRDRAAGDHSAGSGPGGNAGAEIHPQPVDVRAVPHPQPVRLRRRRPGRQAGGHQSPAIRAVAARAWCRRSRPNRPPAKSSATCWSIPRTPRAGRSTTSTI